MNETEIIDTAREALLVYMQMAVPILLIGLLVGVTIALLQALTQIQEMTLVFVPKIIAIVGALFFYLPMMMRTLVEFTQVLADQIVGIG